MLSYDNNASKIFGSIEHQIVNKIMWKTLYMRKIFFSLISPTVVRVNKNIYISGGFMAEYALCLKGLNMWKII